MQHRPTPDPLDLPTMQKSAYASKALAYEGELIRNGRFGKQSAYFNNLTESMQQTKPPTHQLELGKATPMTSARLVKILIADIDTRLPVADRLLYNGSEIFTDMTDQELFFELPVKSLLDEHNAQRRRTLDTAASEKAGKEVFLPEIRVRDLRMVVVDVAAF